MTSLQGKVALITGAGGGLGRAYALLFAKLGASVVVNDLGSSRDGSGASTSLADKVVAEIKEAGGKAYANHQSVADEAGAKSMVEDAVREFGKLDIVINNAGILRDKTLVNMTPEMWDIVMDVHLKGTFLVTHAAIEAMRKAGTAGRIINTSSYAGLKGNFGQANYGAAKAGIAGFTRVVALETRKMGITVNAIAPVAKTRMTEDINMVPEEYQPEDIAPLVAWLCSDDAADVSGRVFGAHGSHYFEYHVEMSPGVDLGKQRWEVADVGARFDEITRPKATASAAAASDGADAVGELFAAVPATFKSDKAGDWSARILFDVAGDFHSLLVDAGKASYQKGAVDGPTGKVTLDSGQTILDMAAGKLAPEQAFMTGKIKTDNMGVLMKFGQFFDLAKAATSAAAGGAEESPFDKARALFGRVPQTFKADRAGDWQARIHFDVGGQPLGLVIEGGSATFVDGAVDNPNAKVTFAEAQTILDMAAGKLAPEQAFMTGKITTDNMGVLMKFGQYFNLEAAAQDDAQTPVESSTGGGVNEAAVGKRYRGGPELVSLDTAVAFAKATDDLNPQYASISNPDGIVPPQYAVRPFFSVMTQAVVDPELGADLLRLVHGEQDMRFHRPLRVHDLIAPRAEISSIERKSSGDLVQVRQWLVCEGEVVCEAISGLFIRSQTKGASQKKEAAAEPQREIIFEDTQVVAEDQPHRYANVSLDQNPIHVDDAVAKAAGHPSVILHGLCTMAFAARAVINGPLQGNPEGLKRLKVRFSKPVLPGWTLTTRLWKVESANGVTTLGVETVNQDGVKVITNGLAEIAL